MAAGLGFKTFTTGEVLTAADTNGYLMQGVLVFASSAARAAAITSPQEGQYSYLKDTNSTEYYDGAAWIAAPIGDITGVTAGTGISGGGTSGTVTITNSMATEIAAKGDLIVGTGAATFDNLTVGANGTTLVADSSTSTGLKWATPTSSSFVGSMCYNASNVSIPNATYTQITWGNETFDAGNIHAASSAVFVTNATGYWLIHGVIQWDTGASGFCQIYVNRKSGATNTTMAGTTRFDSTSYIPLPFSLVVSCTSGDELSVYGYQNSGGARNIQGGGENKTYISVSYLGA